MYKKRFVEPILREEGDVTLTTQVLVSGGTQLPCETKIPCDV